MNAIRKNRAAPSASNEPREKPEWVVSKTFLQRTLNYASTPGDSRETNCIVLDKVTIVSFIKAVR